MTEQQQPNPDPQVSEPPGRDGPAYSTASSQMAAAQPTAPPTVSPTQALNRYEKWTLGLLRGLGADPDDPVIGEKGRWPSTWQSFLWDLAPDKVAPSRDGVVLPQWEEPDWLADLQDGEVDGARKAVRADLDRCHASVTALELKATRLLTPFVALLTGAVALTIFQISAIEASLRGALASIGAMAGSGGIAFLLVGMLRALDADTRLGTSVRATIEQELAVDARFALRSDHQGVQAAKFVLRKKGNRILYARAAISRGLVMLLPSAVFGAVALALAPDSDDSQQPSQSPAPSAPAPPPAPSIATTGPTHTPTKPKASVTTSGPKTGTTPTASPPGSSETSPRS